MSGRGSEILKEALALTPDERAEIAERLLSSLDTPERQRIDDLWADEAEARLAAYERGEMRAIPAAEVFDSLGIKPR